MHARFVLFHLNLIDRSISCLLTMAAGS
uniref:Uncharacterized protein n=1 Tax=Arundo donax TaxID=35708 RepID=A0A0A9EGW3_ARUDO